jgi:hypothetical protein
MRVAEKGRMAEGKSLLGLIRGAQIRYEAQYGDSNYCANMTGLDIQYTTPRYFSPDASVAAGVVGRVTRNTVDAGSFTYTMDIGIDGTINCSGGSCGDVF